MNFITTHPGRKRVKHVFGFPHFENIFNDAMRTNVSDLVKKEKKNNLSTTPAVNIQKLKDRFVLNIALPGIDKKDITIDIDKDRLAISGKVENDSMKYVLKEYSYGQFSRRFVLPEIADVSSIEADMDNGMLTIIVPFKEEAIDHGPKKITIK